METQHDSFELLAPERLSALPAEELLRTIKALATPAPDAPPPDDQLLNELLDANLPEGDIAYVKLMLIYQPWRTRLVDLMKQREKPNA